jgi:protein-S-isoprenylcysteine O-methyltransferase Ste14
MSKAQTCPCAPDRADVCCRAMSIDNRPNTIHWPPIAYLAGLVAPWLLQRWLPLPIVAFDNMADDAMAGVGLALIATGITIDVLALRSFSAMGTPFDPTARAETLVTFGLYAQSRNPMYVGAMIAFLGLALATGNIWRFLALPALLWALLNLAILREERHLEARFGEAWRAWAAKTPRWL